MAQAQIDACKSGSSDKRIQDQEGNVSSVPECPVCLQLCIHPARLPCNHIFCFLCVKGVANQSKRCPMCRQEIPPDFLEKPQLVELDPNQQKEAAAETTTVETPHDEYQWFYEGRNGWWQYDQRTSQELETAYKQGKRSCELLIAGFLYIADFGQMLQLRRNDHSRKRRIKRDLYNAPKKGVAGLRLNNQTSRETEEQQQQQQQQVVREIRGAERPASPASDNMGDGTRTPIPPSNTPQTPAGGTSGDATPSTATRLDHQRSDSLHQVLEQMRSLVLRENLVSGNQQDLHDSIDDGSFSDHTLLPWLHQTSNAAYSSDEEQSAWEAETDKCGSA